jgi:hypothetical protein
MSLDRMHDYPQEAWGTGGEVEAPADADDQVRFARPHQPKINGEVAPSF